MSGFTITYAEFCGLTRLSLHRIKRIALRLDGGIMIFLGKNGSGKSSLVKSLTPLPADKNLYTKDGKKVIHIDGGRYVLTSDFSKKQVHSFIVDGVELNQGGTITVQLDLVKTHFKITEKLSDLIYGDEKFDGMSPAKRKECFLRLSNSDHAYALDVYNRVVEKNRDVTGALKLAKKALATELDKVTSDTVLAEIEAEIEGIEKTMANIVELRKPLDVSTANVLMDIDTNTHKLDRLNEKLLSLVKTPIERLKTREAYQSIITVCSTQLEAIDSQRRGLMEEHRVASKNTELAQANTGTIESLQVLLDGLLETRRTELSKYPSNTPVIDECHQDLVSMVASWETLTEQLTEIFTDIPSNREGKFSMVILEDLKVTEGSQEATIEKARRRVSQLEAEIRHALEHKDNHDAVCPKCEYGFSTRYSPEKVATHQAEVARINDLITMTLALALVETKAYIKDCVQYGEKYRSYFRIVNSNKRLQPIWDYIAKEDILKTAPIEGVSLVGRITSMFQVLHRVAGLQKEIDECNQRMRIAIQAKDLNITQELSRKLSIETKLSELSSTREELLDKVKRTKKEMEIGEQLRVTYKELMETYNQGTTLRYTLTENYRREMVINVHRDLQKLLGVHTHTVCKIKSQRAAIEVHTRNMETYTKAVSDTTTLLKVLSPTTGLIAESMLGFVNMFIETVNEYLKHIWSYPLEVNKYEFGEDATPVITYLFPVTVGESQKRLNDIVEGSTGMREVFNLAFKLATMEYMGLRNTPLYLDEVGANLDAEHKSMLSGVMREIADQQLFSQIFLISHNSEFHAGLASVEYCYLGEEALKVHPEYNRMVEIESY